jgi:hypothetical protein
MLQSNDVWIKNAELSAQSSSEIIRPNVPIYSGQSRF